MRSSTWLIIAVVVAASAVLGVVFFDGCEAGTTVGTAPAAKRRAPAEGGEAREVPGQPPVTAPVPAVLSPAQAVAKARSEYDGGWIPGTRTASRREVTDRYGPWVEYQTIIWTGPDGKDPKAHLARYFELGANAGMAYRGNSPKVFYDAGLDAYFENVFRSPYFYLKKDAKRPEAQYRAWPKVRDEWKKDRSRKDLLARKPCLSDPAIVKIQEDFLTNTSVKPFLNLGRRPLAVDLRDEPSITQSANPFSYCFSEHCLGRFREWLKERYGTLDALNDEWQTDFADWGGVEPLTTEEIRKREYARWDREGKVNLAPWADHREFMDDVFAGKTDYFVKYVRKMLPGAFCGLEGLQMPHAFGGYDYWKLSRVMTWAEPYDIRCNREMMRSFNPRCICVATGFEMQAEKLLRKLWYLALMGDRGIIVWPFAGNDDRLVNRNSADYEITPVGREVSKALRAMRTGTADLLTTAEKQYSPIAIYYSHASIRADWMLETKVDGGTWINRYSSYESKNNQMARARQALGKLIEDLGYQYRYVSYEEVANGALKKEGFKVCFAPRLHAVSKKEVAGVREFLEGGGTFITDIHPGIMDEHCKWADTGLRGLLGLEPLDRLKWQFKPEKSEVRLRSDHEFTSLTTFVDKSIAAAIPKRSTFAEGETLTFGCDPFFAYESARAEPTGNAIRMFVQEQLSHAGLPEAVGCVEELDLGFRRPVGIETHFYRGKAIDIVALGKNHGYLITEALEDLAEKETIQPSVTVKVTLPYKAFAHDVGRKGSMGLTDSVEVEIRQERPAVIALLAYEISELDARVAKEGNVLKISGRLIAKGEVPEWALHVIGVGIEKDGEYYPLTTILCNEDGSFDEDYEIQSGVGEGRQTLVLRDVISMKEVRAPIDF